jgi:hypothetical protein
VIDDNPFRSKLIPHRCGASREYCLIDDDTVLWFCSLCRIVVDFEKNGKRINEYSKETINDSV